MIPNLRGERCAMIICEHSRHLKVALTFVIYSTFFLYVDLKKKMTLVEYKGECEQVVKSIHYVSNKTSGVFERGKVRCQRYLSSGSQSVSLADHRKSTEVLQRLPAWGKRLHQRHAQQENYRSHLVLDRLGLWEIHAETINQISDN